jgi:FtsH-binding integral membrane protein
MRAFSGLKLSQVGAFIFGLFVIADTNAILQKNYNGDVVQATLDYFLDFVNLLSFVGDENN